MSDIREDIKSLLNLSSDTSDEDLIKALGEEIKKYHPTGSEGEELRNEKTERFTKIHNLYKKFKAVLDQEKKNSTALVPLDAQALTIASEMDQIESYYVTAQLKESVRRLEETKDFNTDRIRSLEKENNQLKEQIAKLREERDQKEKTQLIELYRQSGKKQTWGFLSLAAGLVTVIPACSKFMSEVLGELSSTIITILFFVAALVLFFDWIFCKIRSTVVNDMACQFMDGAFLEQHLPLKKEKSYGTTYNYYVSEQSLRAIITESLNSKFRNILFYFDRNIVVEHVKNLVVTHFLEFGQFKDRESQKFDTLFRLRFCEKGPVETVDDLFNDDD